ncbi:MAG: diadenylate cyclase [Acidobacteriota bacterium]
MWGYQVHFRIEHEGHSHSLFQLLDKRFHPEVFVVGVRIEEHANRYPVCVEPEDDFWLTPDAFEGVLRTAVEIVSTYPESRMFHTHPMAQKQLEESLFKRGVQDAVSKMISECPSKPDGMRYYPSFPVKLDCFLVSLVLGLQEEVVASHGSLSVDRVPIHDCRSCEVATSLIDAAIHAYLDDVASELLKPDPGADLSASKSPGEILRAAGNLLMTGIAYKTDPGVTGYWGTIFDAWNRISSLKYERAIGKGRVVLARQDHPAIAPEITFAQPVKVHDSRAARKLLQLASKDLALHSNVMYLFGLAKIGNYLAAQEDLYEVNFLDHHLWELAHAGHVLMRVQFGQPSLPAPAFDEKKMRKDLARIFPQITSHQRDLLVCLVNEAVGEKHGTMLVIAEDAANEAKRLVNQATLVAPRLLRADLLRQLTPIDGAVLVDPSGTCHAIGVILDGMATQKGNPARGARFNSAVRYIETQKKACLAVIVSEDGGVDIIPELRPAVRRSTIENALDELEALMRSEPLKVRHYGRVTELLEERRFYLLPEHCDRANQLIAAAEERLAKDNPEAPRIIRRQFEPDPDFAPGLYYEHESTLVGAGDKGHE